MNVGPAGARNAGLATVTTPYVAFVDSDVEVAAADLIRLARHFADPAVGLVGPQVTGVARSAHPAGSRSTTPSPRPSPSGRAPARAARRRRRLAPQRLPGRPHRRTRRGFDPDLRVGEDVDLVWRLVEAGHRVRYDPTVVARHDTRPTMQRLARPQVRLRHRRSRPRRAPRQQARTRRPHARPTPSPPLHCCSADAGRSPSLPSHSPPGPAPSAPALPEAAGTQTRSPPDSPSAACGWAVRQESALLLRHWWPAAVAGAVSITQDVRRALATAVAVDHDSCRSASSGSTATPSRPRSCHPRRRPPPGRPRLRSRPLVGRRSGQALHACCFHADRAPPEPVG